MLEILFVILHFFACTLLICGVLLCLQHAENKRPRIYLAIFSFVTAFGVAYRLYIAHRTGMPTLVNEVLPTYVLIGGILEMLLIYLYLMEVVKPNWVNIKRLSLLSLPWLLVWCVCMLIYPDIRDLSSFSEMIQHIGEFNVWFRLLILFLCFIPYTILLLHIPYKWVQSRVNFKSIHTYVIGVQIIGLLFSTVVLTGSVQTRCILLLFGMLFFFYITYQELYFCLIPASVNKTAVPPVVAETLPPEDSTGQNKTATENPLWEKLTRQMDEEELWRNPDLTLEDLSKVLCTNRTTLTQLIQQQGYSGYSEFINRRRIEAFTKAIDSSKPVSTQQLLQKTGFRSKSTALRNFRLYMGCTPSEYVLQTTQQNKEN